MKFNIWTIFLIIIILNLIFQIHGDIMFNQQLRKKSQNLKSMFGQEISKQNNLKTMLAKLNQDIFIERLARVKLNLIKKGETAYKICQ